MAAEQAECRMQPYSAGGRKHQRGVTAAGHDQQEQYCQTGSWWVSTVLEAYWKYPLREEGWLESVLPRPDSGYYIEWLRGLHNT